MGLNDLAKKKTATTGTKKSNGVVLDVDDKIKEEVDNWVENSRTFKDAKACMEQAERVILDHVTPQWKAACRVEGKVETSAKVGPIRISWKGKSQFVTSSSLGDGEAAKQVFGKDFDKYFKEVEGPIEFTQEAVNNPEINVKLTEFIGKLMEEHPDVDIVTNKVKVVTKDEIYNDFVLGNSDEIENKLAAAGIKLTKPTIAVR